MDSSSDRGGRSHTKRNLAIVAILVVIVVIGVVVVSGYVFGLSGCFGGIGCSVSASTSCNSQTKSCEIRMTDHDSLPNVVATSCTFDVGNSTILGTLSNAVGEASSNVTLIPNSTVMVYCSGYQETPQVGSQVTGFVETGNSGGIPFSATWT